MDANKLSRRLWQGCYALIEAGFDVMARYPYDMTEMHWNSDLYDPPADDGEERQDQAPRRPGGPRAGRTIKVVPPPASQRYQAARPKRIPARDSRRKQPV